MGGEYDVLSREPTSEESDIKELSQLEENIQINGNDQSITMIYFAAHQLII